jgi:SAM-dependent methyltransferase
VLQDNVFTHSEGDRWFARNRSALNDFDAAADLPLRLLSLYDLRPECALEIGAANGFRLAEIHQRTGARVIAVEPSAQAILEGKAALPSVRFVRGAAHSIPLRREFDLVIVNFVFHWIDRANLFRSIAEVDRLVRDDGWLIIGDFHPVNRMQVRYHHLKDGNVFTFKQNYADTFLASGLYHSVCLLTGDHAGKGLEPAVSEEERIGASLLQKSLRGHFMATKMDVHRG